MASEVANKPGRVAAIDILRALTMVWMLFVNDIPGLEGVPHWLFHAHTNEDMLGFSDLVFPAFLFCVGMSIPFAIESRLKRGSTMGATIGHILERTLALVVMGLFIMNCDNGAGGINWNWFSLMIATGFFLIWTDYPKSDHRYTRLLQWAGILLLTGILLYCDVVGEPFHTGWWGILGLIGWMYAVCALCYLLTRGHFSLTILVWIVFILLCILNQTDLIPQHYFSRNILLPFIPGGWTHHAIGFSGLMASLFLKRLTAKGKYWQLAGLYVALAITSLMAGFVAHEYWIVSKIQATPTWLFFSLSVNFGLLALVFWLSDICGRKQWFALIAPAGSATLTCYLIPYFWYPIMGIANLSIPGWQGWTGIVISIIYAFLIVQITRLLVWLGVKVKL